MTIEIYKDVTGYEGLYKVSNLGNVKGLKRKNILSIAISQNGYSRVGLWKNGIPKMAFLARELAKARIETDKYFVRCKECEGIGYMYMYFESKGYLTVNMIAAELGISHIKLNKLLCGWGVQYKQTDCYFLYHQYRDKGYTIHRPYPYLDSQGNTKTSQHMYWTEKGKKFIVELYNKKLAA